MIRCICRIYTCSSCRTGDRRFERWTSDGRGGRTEAGSCPECGQQLDVLCDTCGGPLAHVRTEDVTWHYLGRWSMFLAVLAAGGIVGRLRGLVVGFLAVLLLAMIAAWRRSRVPSVVGITHDHQADGLTLDALRARALAHERSRSVRLALVVSALLVAGLIAGFCHLSAGWLIASAALGAALSSGRWMAIGRFQVLTIDSRPLLVVWRQDPDVRQSVRLRERLRINARRVLGRQPDVFELQRIEGELERSIDSREYVASTHEQSDLAMLRLVVLRAMAGMADGDDGGKPEGKDADGRAEGRGRTEDADGRGQHA